MTPRVSITMSTYNVENFIEESLNCIVNQTLKDIEIIIIDDGSIDSTPKILESFAKNDKRIKLLLKLENEGLAIARNEALKMAKGKYIAFVDGDDLVDVNLFKKAYNLIERQKSDMVIWDYAIFYNHKDLKKNKCVPSELSNLDSKNKMRLLQRPAFSCVKMIKKDIVNSLNINFPKGLAKQDIPVNWKLITTLDKIVILPERLYYYRQQPNSTSSRKDKVLFDLAYVMDITKDYLIENNLYNKYKNEFLRQRLNLLFGMVDNINKKYKLEAEKIINDRLSKDEKEYIHSKKPLNQQARWYYKSLEGDYISVMKKNSWMFIRALYRRTK